MFCKQCGAELETGAVFCGNCGASVEVNEVPNTTEEPPVQPQPPVTPQPPQNKTDNKALIFTIISVVVVVFVAALLLIPKLSGGAGKSNRPEEEPFEEVVTPEEDGLDIGEIESIIASDANDADMSVCIIDLKNNKEYATRNADMAMSASALVNVPILYAVSEDLGEDSYRWDNEVRFTYRYSGRGKIKQADDGNYFDLDYLVQQMLNYSDNNATNSLIDYYGNSFIGELCRQNDYYSVDIQRYLGESSEYRDNYISAKDAAKIMAEMYRSKNGCVNKNYLLSNFRIVDGAANNGLGRNLPGNVTFLNHNGVTSSIYNEVAIVRSSDVEYIIAVISNNGKMESSADTVARISDYVYTTLSR